MFGNISPHGLAVMESILSGIPGVVVYIDNVLVTGKCEEELVLSLNTDLKHRYFDDNAAWAKLSRPC